MARWQENCGSNSAMIRFSAWLPLLVLLATACSTSRTPRAVWFNEQDKANFIVRYYTDDVNYVLKPEKTEGRFLSVLKKDEALEVAKRQPGRELAVIILVYYESQDEADRVKSKWRKLLSEMGYQRVVFSCGIGTRQLNGLLVLPEEG
jgi:hypothetical protein